MADDLRDAILRGELPPAMQLRQAELAARLGISRVPIREALQVLHGEGLLFHRPNSGYYVRHLDAAELSQIYLMLDALESLLLSKLRPATTEDLDQLIATNEQIEGAVKRYAVREFVDLNRELHFRIFSLGEQPLVVEELSRLWIMSESYRVLHLRAYLDQSETIEQHRQMIQAIKNGDSRLLLRLSTAHRQAGKTRILRALGTWL